MRLTSYTDYALRLLIYLAVNGEQSTTIAEVAERYGISRNHLVKVAHQLSVTGYVTATRGKKGGLRLARSADQIAVGDVVRKMEVELAVVPCLDTSVPSMCRIAPACHLKVAMARAQDAFLHELDTVTLADIAMAPEPLQELLQIRLG